MDQAARDRIEGEIKDAASQRFPGEVQGVVVLQHGHERGAKPAEITIRVVIRPDWPGGQQRQLRDFWESHRAEMEQFGRDLSEQYPHARHLEFTHANSRSRIKATRAIVVPVGRTSGPRSHEDGTAAGGLTPVMARLGPAELEIVDTLISAGIAPNRAEAIRWSLARISERPAYAQLRERTREIERLKSEF